jgi:hypothetical protein
MGGCASRITARGETGGAGWRSKQEGTIHSAAANAGWLQGSAAYTPNNRAYHDISGTFNIGMGDKFDESAGQELGAGGYMVLPPGMKHYAWTPAETIIQVHGMGPFVINYVNPTDDPRNEETGAISVAVSNSAAL